MKKLIRFELPLRFKMLLLFALSVSLAGCATHKEKAEKPPLERGWIGGEYRLAKANRSRAMDLIFPTPGIRRYDHFPTNLSQAQNVGILIHALKTNAPARLAGLRQDDLILSLNHQPVTSLRDFRRAVDQTKPGTLLPVSAYRDGQVVDYNVPVGKETYRRGGMLSITFPSVVHGWDLWPNPDFSLVLVGFEVNRGLRHDLGRKQHEIYDRDWEAWLVIFEASMGKHILKQESVLPTTAARAGGDMTTAHMSPTRTAHDALEVTANP